MGDLYEKQKDGTLKPIEQSEYLIKKLNTYLWLKEHHLELDEIKFVLTQPFE